MSKKHNLWLLRENNVTETIDVTIYLDEQEKNCPNENLILLCKERYLFYVTRT